MCIKGSKWGFTLFCLKFSATIEFQVENFFLVFVQAISEVVDLFIRIAFLKLTNGLCCCN